MPRGGRLWCFGAADIVGGLDCYIADASTSALCVETQNLWHLPGYWDSGMQNGSEKFSHWRVCGLVFDMDAYS